MKSINRIRKPEPTTFTQMVAKQRMRNKIGKSWQNEGSVAVPGLRDPKDIADEIWGDVTNLIAHKCDE